MDNGESSYRRFLSGDERAFSEIIGMHKDNLIFFINRYVHNIAIAEELAEDVFAELLIYKRRYNFKTSLKTYIFTKEGLEVSFYTPFTVKGLFKKVINVEKSILAEIKENIFG